MGENRHEHAAIADALLCYLRFCRLPSSVNLHGGAKPRPAALYQRLQQWWVHFRRVFVDDPRWVPLVGDQSEDRANDYIQFRCFNKDRHQARTLRKVLLVEPRNLELNYEAIRRWVLL